MNFDSSPHPYATRSQAASIFLAFCGRVQRSPLKMSYNFGLFWKQCPISCLESIPSYFSATYCGVLAHLVFVAARFGASNQMLAHCFCLIEWTLHIDNEVENIIIAVVVIAFLVAVLSVLLGDKCTESVSLAFISIPSRWWFKLVVVALSSACTGKS